MELLHSLNDLIDFVLRRKNGRTDMEGTLLLTETGATDADDAGLVEELHAVEVIGRAALLLGSLNGLGRHGDAEVGVEGTISGLAVDTLELVETAGELVGSSLEGGHNLVLLLLPERIRGLAGLGRIDHDIDGVLTIDVGAAADGDELVELVLDGLVKVVELEVTSSSAALTEEALGGGVEGDELDVLGLLTEVEDDLSEGLELVAGSVDVGLVDLIGQDADLLLGAETDDILNVLAREALAGGVTGVDGGEGLDLETLLLGLVEGLLDLVHIEAPVVLLIEVVADHLATIDGDTGGVERILRNRDEDGVLGTVDEELEGILDGLGGTVGEEDLGVVSLVTISLGDVVGDVLADLLDTHGVTVGTGTTRVGGDELLGSLDGIAVELLGALGHELGPGGEGEDLTKEGHGLLLHALGVTDVAVEKLVEGELLAGLHLLLDLAGADDDLASDGVLGLDNLPNDPIGKAIPFG